MRIELETALADQRPLVERLLQLYLYEFSHLANLEIDELGRYPYPYLDRYWEEPGRYPFLIRADSRLAGFVLIMERALIEPGAEGHDVAEFFVLRTLRRYRVGEAAARQAFDRFPGHWWVEVHPANMEAQSFWRAVLGRYAGGSLQERARPAADGSGLTLTFVSPGGEGNPSL